MKSINFYQVSEKMPNHGQEVWYLKYSPFYGSHEFAFTRIEYNWEEYDDKGRTGVTIGYTAGETQPVNCVLSCGLDDKMYWCDVNDIWDLLDK